MAPVGGHAVDLVGGLCGFNRIGAVVLDLTQEVLEDVRQVAPAIQRFTQDCFAAFKRGTWRLIVRVEAVEDARGHAMTAERKHSPLARVS